MKKINKSEDLRERQERKELIFELVYKLSFPTIMIVALAIALIIRTNM